MTNDSTASWVAQYRASVCDTPTPMLDTAILSAARRQSASRRTVRHIRGASFIAAFALIALSAVWHVRQPGFDPRPAAADYGRYEGISRYYLLEVETPRFTGFGVHEGMP